MKKEECIFCKIAEGKIPGVKIWEDNEFLAILSSHPNTEGVTLVLTKKHYDSYVFDMPEDVYQRFMATVKKVVRVLEKGLGIKRVAMVMEGMGVNHAHIKLYPLYGITEKFEETWAKEKVFFEKYQGYISTQLGPSADISELKKLAEEIKNK